MNMRLLAGLLFAVSVVGFSLGATLPLVSLRLHEAGAGTLEIGMISARLSRAAPFLHQHTVGCG